MGKILYKSIMRIMEKEYKKAQRMPDSLERDARLKNSYFVVRMMPSNSLRSMSMSSGGQFSYDNARALVLMANGHLMRGLRLLLNAVPSARIRE